MTSLSPRPPSLRQVILTTTGQDVRQCQQCALCDEHVDAEQDLTFATLVQLVQMNDEEALTSRTVWSERVLQSARHRCTSRLNLEAIVLALRDEARRRGLAGLSA